MNVSEAYCISNQLSLIQFSSESQGENAECLCRVKHRRSKGTSVVQLWYDGSKNLVISIETELADWNICSNHCHSATDVETALSALAKY